jgi:SNF2 family DNA or RNA helicase/uncharacterized protein (DUF3820 family)
LETIRERTNHYFFMDQMSLIQRSFFWPVMVCHHFLPLLHLVSAVGLLLMAPFSVALSIPAPPGCSYFPFQVEAIRDLVRSDRILLGDEMGLGKTISVIGALNVLGSKQRVLIIAPKSVLPSWEYELRTWLVDPSWSIGAASAKGGFPPTTNVGILLMNYDIVNKFRDEIDTLGPYDIVVCDEAHYLKNGEAIRTKAILGDYGLSDKVSRGIATQQLWFLTGSPILNSPIELFPLLRALDPAFQIIPELGSIENFRDRYCGWQETPWGISYKGGRNLPELRRRLREMREDGTPLMVRRTKLEVLKDLPDKRHQLLPLEDDGDMAAEEAHAMLDAVLQMFEGQNPTLPSPTGGDLMMEHNATGLKSLKIAELKSMLRDRDFRTNGSKKELIARLVQTGRRNQQNHNVTTEHEVPLVHESAQSALRSAPTGGRRVEILRELLAKKKWWREWEVTNKKATEKAMLGALCAARHETALRKVPYAIEILESALVSHKVVVFAYHRDVQEALFRAFEGRAVALHGGSTLEERADAVQRFQTDASVRLFVGSIRAAGIGITLTAASHVLFVELDWSPLIVQQAEDRCHRVGQKASVLVQYLFFKNSVDEHLAQLLASKQSTVSAAIDQPEGAMSWIFDFGKHKEVSVADVAGSDPDYLDWIVQQDAHHGKVELSAALKELGYLDRPSVAFESGSVHQTEEQKATMNDRRKSSKGDMHGSFILTFGKYEGKRLGEVPIGYLIWLNGSGAARRDFRLSTALRGYIARVE